MMAMTLKQQNELTLRKLELQMIEDYFSKEARDNRKQYGQKSSGQMKAILKKYDFEKWMTVVWDDSKTKEFEEALNKLYTISVPFSVKITKNIGVTRGREGYYSWKVKDTDYIW